MMDNVESIQAKTKAELAAMEKTDFFKLPAKPSSLLESDLKGSHLRRFDAEKEEKDLAALGRKFQAQLAAIHGVKPSSFLEEDPVDDSMEKVNEEMKKFAQIVDDQKKQAAESKQWAAKMHEKLEADREHDKSAMEAMDAAGKPSSFVEVSSDGKIMPTIPDVAVFDPNKKYDIGAMKEKLERDQDQVQDAKQKFEDAMDSWKNDKLQKLTFEDDDEAGASSFLETGQGDQAAEAQRVEREVQRNEKALKKLSKFVQLPFFTSVKKYAAQPVASLLENGHTSAEIADMRGLVKSLQHAPQVEELDGDMAQAQAKLVKVQTQVDAELTELKKKLEAQAKAKAITAELHKKALASRARLQEDFKHMNVKFHHDPEWDSLLQHLQAGGGDGSPTNDDPPAAPGETVSDGDMQSTVDNAKDDTQGGQGSDIQTHLPIDGDLDGVAGGSLLQTKDLRTH